MGGACRALRGAGELCSALVCSCMYVRQGFTPCPFFCGFAFVLAYLISTPVLVCVDS